MAQKANIIVDQGSTYETSLILQDDIGNALDLTGYTAAAKIRKHYTSSNATSFTSTVTPGIGEVTIGLTSTVTAAMDAGRYVYDIEVTDASGIITRVVEGIVTVTPGVTY